MNRRIDYENIKKVFATILTLAILISSMGIATESSAFTKKKNGLTLKGESSIEVKKGSAWGSVSPKSYLSIASEYKYINKSGVVKKVPTDLTGAGNSTGAS